MITAKVVADSKNEFGHRLTTMVVTFNRFILAEFNTHRMFSRNSASSRAIPFDKPTAKTDMRRLVMNQPFIPIAYQKEHTGMQGTEYITDELTNIYLNQQWLFVRDCAVDAASRMASNACTKQIVNRLIEPFMWHTVIVTSSEWENFFKLRCPQYQNTKYLGKDAPYFRSKKDYLNHYEEEGDVNEQTWRNRNRGQAEIHMMALAEAMWDAYNESEPKLLQPGEWHIPFGDNIDEKRLTENLYELNGEKFLINSEIIEQAKIEIATARCARVSYLNYEGTDDYVKDFHLFKGLRDSGHMSPFEHVAKAMGREDLDNYMVIEAGKVKVGWCRNFCGFIQMRAMIEQ
jgi:thymidylate synthase ThyX